MTPTDTPCVSSRVHAGLCFRLPLVSRKLLLDLADHAYLRRNPEPASAGILVLFCLYLGLYHALFGALIAAFRRSGLGTQGALLLSPFAWVAVELARARITGFPWDLLGIAQIDNPLLTRLAPFTGAYGISFVIAAVNAFG